MVGRKPEKILATIVDWWRQAFKLHCLKCPKAVPKKQNLDQKINDENLMFGVYLLVPDFLEESLKANKH